MQRSDSFHSVQRIIDAKHRKNYGFGLDIGMRIRAAFFHAQKGFCFYCEKEMTLEENPPRGAKQNKFCSIDHVVARSEGGDKSSIWNMVGACSSCNSKKQSKDSLAYWYGKRGSTVNTSIFKYEDLPDIQLRAGIIFLAMNSNSLGNTKLTKMLVG